MDSALHERSGEITALMADFTGRIFASGASMANLTALAAARDDKLRWDERNKAVIYVSEQTHASVSKGLHIIGFGRSQIRMISTDADFRMDMECLAQAIAEDSKIGKRPFAVVASVGTTFGIWGRN